MGDCGGDGNMAVTGKERRSPSPSPRPGPDPSTIKDECWAAAEEAAQEVLNWIHPLLDSEEKRKDVIDYIQKLFKDSLGCEVFPYGSVPLKTYLPDGDIDFTVLSGPNAVPISPQDVVSVLWEEEQNEYAEYEVRDTQFIEGAEVQIVKCLVQNIVIDISFNQSGGLCTLWFLEQVDRMVQKDHLFKRSILLVKTWCYYESRILGAHHGLISTYALETLVLYIFHLFHSSLTGPLKVLYIFLDYFSKFDWDNYGISLNGPVCNATLPSIVVEMPDNGGNDLMLSDEFLDNCTGLFSVPCGGDETTKPNQSFQAKYLNIIDPLNDCNNLGRSVHRGNFYRIRSAFKYGARKLGRILSLHRDSIADEIKDFFSNTQERHGHKSGRDISKPLPVSGSEGYLYMSSSSEVLFEDDLLLKSSIGDFENDSIGVEDKCTSVFSDELNTAVYSSKIVSEGCYLVDGSAVTGNRLFGDANDLSSSRLSADGATDCLSNHSTGNVNLKIESSCHVDKVGGIVEKVEFDPSLEPIETCYLSDTDKYEDIFSKGSAISSPKTDTLETSFLDFRERDFASLAGGDSEPLNPLSDLTGDYHSHIRCLLFSQGIHGYTSSARVAQSHPPSPSRFRSKKPWDTVRQSMPLRQTSVAQTSSNLVYAGPPLDVAGNFAPPSSAAIECEEKRKTRGTGTYFPTMNGFCRERRGKGKGRAPGNHHHQLQRQSRINSSSPVLSPTSSFENGSYEFPSPRSLVLGRWDSGASNQSHSSAGTETVVNGFSNPPSKIEFGSLGDLPEILLSGSFHIRDLDPTLSVKGNSSKSVQGGKESVGEAFQLKNEEEFPPLSA